MTGSGAYTDEMGRFLRLSDEELARLLAGEAGAADEAFDEVTTFLADVRRTYATTPPNDQTRARHVAALGATARLAAENGNPVAGPARNDLGSVGQIPGRPMGRTIMENARSVLLKGAVGVLAVSLSTVGMAYAGVDLPGTAAERAIEAVTGVDLPNQAEGQSQEPDKSVNDEVRAVHDRNLEGCEHGQAVAAAASANREGDGGSDNDPCDKNNNGSSTATSNGKDKSAKGRARAAEASEGRSADPGSAADHAKSNGGGNADAPSGGGGHAKGHANKPADPGNAGGSSASQGGNGKSATDHGQGNNDDTTDDGLTTRPTDPGKGIGGAVSGAAHGNNPNK